jgi:hypothetical protein
MRGMPAGYLTYAATSINAPVPFFCHFSAWPRELKDIAYLPNIEHVPFFKPFSRSRATAPFALLARGLGERFAWILAAESLEAEVTG